MYRVLLECDPFKPSSKCLITLFNTARNGKIRVVLKSLSSDFAQGGEAFEIMESLAEALNYPPTEEFRRLLLISIREVCEMVEARKVWEKTYEGQIWLRRIAATKEMRAKKR